jgi:outer membrane protein assembly factor BamB
MCLDVRSGETAWDTEVFQQSATAPGIHGKNSHASSTPVLVDNRLYVHFGHQGTACLDTKGTVLWTNQTIQYEPVHGNGGSPVVADEKLVFSVDGANQAFIIALDCKDGRELWRRDRKSTATRKFSFSTPLVVDVGARTLIVSPGSDVVHALDLKDGSIVWYVRYDGYSVIPRPIFGHGMVFMTTGYGTPSVLAIRVDGSGDVTDTHVAWQLQRSAPHAPSLLLVKDELYMVSDRGIASCMDAKSGELHWQQRVGSAYSASPIYANNRIYLQSEDGVGTVLAAGTTFKSLAENRLEERTLASYGVDGNAIILRTQNHLYRIE